MVPRQTKDNHMTTVTTQGHIPSSKSEIIKNSRSSNCSYSRHICRYHQKIQETKRTPKANTPKVHKFTTVRTDRLHKAGGGLITLIRDNITFTTTDIPSAINTHNTKLQMVKVNINNTKHITIANIHIPPRDSTSTH